MDILKIQGRVLLLLIGSLVLSDTALAGLITRLNVNNDGSQMTFGKTGAQAMSADGHFVTFLAHPDNSCLEGFGLLLRDQQSGQSSCLNIFADPDSPPAISTDGRFIVSYNEGNTCFGVNLYDRVTQQSSCYLDTITTNLEKPNISDDGNLLATGFSLNDVDDAGLIKHSIAILNRSSNQTINLGDTDNGSSSGVTLSGDGQFVVFASNSSTLVANDTNNANDIFVMEIATGNISRISIASDGSEANGDSGQCDISSNVLLCKTPAISHDGRYVAFSSEASNLVAGDNNHHGDMFVHDRQTHVTSRISIASNGSEANGTSETPAISNDGRFIAYVADATNLVVGDNAQCSALDDQGLPTNFNCHHLYLHDRQTQQTIRLSETAMGIRGDNDSSAPSISADGRYITFTSLATNLVYQDTNTNPDVFIYDRLGVNPTADLAVTLAANNTGLNVYEYTLTVVNQGPDSAKAVNVVVTLPDTAAPWNAVTGCTLMSNPHVISCDVGEMAKNATLSRKLTMTSGQAGIMATAVVSAYTTDPNNANNTASVSSVASWFALTVNKAGSGQGSVNSNLAGINCGADCTEAYPKNALVTLTVTPNDNFSIFTGWQGACTGMAPCTVTMDAAKSVTATFVKSYPLTILKGGSGKGKVTSELPGIDCGTDCSEVYPEGTLVNLSITPRENSIFTGWEGACTGMASCTVTIDAAKSVTATFAMTNFPLTIVKDGSGTGTVSSDIAGINCGTECTTAYPAGTLVNLTATPLENSIFTGWTGACTGMDTCMVTMDAAKTVTATFTLNTGTQTYTLNIVKGGAGKGKVKSDLAGIVCGRDCTEDYPSGTLVTLTAIPRANSSFVRWRGACAGVTGSVCEVTMDKAKQVKAVFRLIPITPQL
jgi:hypothetical protein